MINQAGKLSFLDMLAVGTRCQWIPLCQTVFFKSKTSSGHARVAKITINKDNYQCLSGGWYEQKVENQAVAALLFAKTIFSCPKVGQSVLIILLCRLFKVCIFPIL